MTDYAVAHLAALELVALPLSYRCCTHSVLQKCNNFNAVIPLVDPVVLV
jgi:hypothetical protein